MTPLTLPLAFAWLVAVAVALLDARQRWVGYASVLALALIVAGDIWLLASVVGGANPELITGDWPQGVGIRMRADLLSATFTLVTTAVLLAILLHEATRGIQSRTFPALVLFLATGLHGLFLTADAFNFYVFFELAMTASFALSSYGRRRAEVRAAWTFVVVNLVGSVTLLYAMGALYHLAGTLDLEQLRAWAGREDNPPLAYIGALLLAAFSLKLGLFPFHFWVPPVYRDTRPAVAAILSGVLVNIASYGLLRFGSGLLREERAGADWLLVALGVVSAVYGTVLAVSRSPNAEVLAYMSVAQAGYIVLAVGLGGPEGMAAGLLLAVAGSFDKALLFLSLEGGPRSSRWSFVVGALSITGVPLSIGFVAKAALLAAAVRAGAGWAAAWLVVATIVGLFALFRTFDTAPGSEAGERRISRAGAVGASLLALVVLFSSVWPEPLVALSERAAHELTGGTR